MTNSQSPYFPTTTQNTSKKCPLCSIFFPDLDSLEKHASFCNGTLPSILKQQNEEEEEETIRCPYCMKYIEKSMYAKHIQEESVLFDTEIQKEEHKEVKVEKEKVEEKNIPFAIDLTQFSINSSPITTIHKPAPTQKKTRINFNKDEYRAGQPLFESDEEFSPIKGFISIFELSNEQQDFYRKQFEQYSGLRTLPQQQQPQDGYVKKYKPMAFIKKKRK